MTTAKPRCFAVENYTAPFSLSLSKNQSKKQKQKKKSHMHKARKTTQHHSFNVLSSSRPSPVEQSFSGLKVVISISTEEVLWMQKQKEKKKNKRVTCIKLPKVLILVSRITLHVYQVYLQATFSSKITLGRIKLINCWKHCFKMCNYDVSMTNSSSLKR